METTIQDITAQCTGRVIAVSDIHGHGHYLKGLLKKISFTKEDTLVIIGDLIEKGGNSLATVRYCMELLKEGYHIGMSAGNVDLARLGTFFDRSEGHGERFLGELSWTRDVWRCGLFLEILSEMGVEPSEIRPEDVAGLKGQIETRYAQELAFLKDRPTIITCGNYIFVHAGIPTDRLETLLDQDGFSFLKTDAFMEQEHMFERCVVVGHWPVCLYQKEIDCMNPVFDYGRHAVAIDGGCALKKGAQLNALVIPRPDAAMEEIVAVAYDDYPIVYAKTAQKARPATVCIKYYDAEVEVLLRQDKTSQVPGHPDGDLQAPGGRTWLGLSAQPQALVTLRHKSSGVVFDAPENYLYRRGEKTLCSDFINAALEIGAGDALKLVVETVAGAIVKKDGKMGWYFGSLGV